MASQGKKTFSCPYCGAPGFKKNLLKTHVKEVHQEHFVDFKKMFKGMK